MTDTVQPATRVTLNRDRVMRAAVDLADQLGLEAVSMRRLGQELGVEAMSLYNHVSNKADLVDGMVDVVLGEVNEQASRPGGPTATKDWKAALRWRILGSREVMLRHKWMPGALESRTSLNPALIVYYDGVLATMRAGGFSYDLAHHALHALGSRALGFAQELFDPATPADDAASQAQLVALADQAPHLVEMMAEIAHDDPDSTLGWCDDQAEFEFSLDLLLDGLERHRSAP